MKKQISIVCLCIFVITTLTACTIDAENVNSFKKEFGIDSMSESISDVGKSLSVFKDFINFMEEMEGMDEANLPEEEIEKRLKEQIDQKQ